jgi:hypothetical protein
MKKIYSADDSLQVGMIKSVLEQEGINCLIKNQMLSGALGEIPPLECWPELWVTDDRDSSRAANIVEALLAQTEVNTPSWQCTCGEQIEGQFSACWKCGGEKPLPE